MLPTGFQGNLSALFNGGQNMKPFFLELVF
jgi:hypothetical protein